AKKSTMNPNDIFFAPRFLIYRYFMAPVFGTLFFLIGTAFLFLISVGRWRVKSWPRFSEKRTIPLEPTREKSGVYTYWCADVAIFTGMAVTFFSLLAFLAFCC